MDVTGQYSVLRLQPNEKVISIPVPGQQDPTKPGLVGILTVPPGVSSPSSDTHPIALLLHGLGGHKNYTYMKITAQGLASKQGWYSFRFDFRDCGDSQVTAPADEHGYLPIRTQERDREDLDTVVRFFNDPANYRHLLNLYSGQNGSPATLHPHAILSHSRGSIPMFTWSIQQWQKHLSDPGCRNTSHVLVKYLVSLSGRYAGKGLDEFMKQQHGVNWFEKGADSHRVSYVYKNRQFSQPVKVHRDELMGTAYHEYRGQWDLKQLNDSGFYRVLIMHGEKDDRVPVGDAAKFAGALNKVLRVVYVPEGDHNFYGTEEITEENADEKNSGKLPVNSRGLVNYNYFVSEKICEWLGEASNQERLD